MTDIKVTPLTVTVSDDGKAIVYNHATVSFELGTPAGSGSVAWSGVTGKPTTLSGYGITDAASDAELASAISGLSAVYQPLDGDLTSIAGLSTTSYGRGFLTLADDAATAIKVAAMSPTWTGQHRFTANPITGAGTYDGVSVGYRAGLAEVWFSDTAGAADAKITGMRYGGGTFSLVSTDDAMSAARTVWSATRSGLAWSAIQYGNDTDKPPHTFYGALEVNAGTNNSVRILKDTGIPVFSARNVAQTTTYFEIGYDIGAEELFAWSARAASIYGIYTDSTLRYRIDSTGAHTCYGPLTSRTNLISRSATSTYGWAELTPGNASRSGYVGFYSFTSGVQQGYIGYSATNAAFNAGTLEYVAGTHSFTGGLVLASPTGGDQGTGTLNATGLFVNGVALNPTSSGTYTPTLTNVTNLSASSAGTFRWSRVGNIVTVSGRVTLTVSSAAEYELGASLPVASAFTSSDDLTGSVSTRLSTTDAGLIDADATNDRARVRMSPLSTGAGQIYGLLFQYEVL